ncbi:MAG TPA: hypothetical protein VF610_11095 [Segetibacter sp.]|jgi:hypothetical protein
MLFIFILTCISAIVYALSNIVILLGFVDQWDEYIKSGTMPEPDLIERSQAILARLFYLALLIVILSILIKAKHHA